MPAVLKSVHASPASMVMCMMMISMMLCMSKLNIRETQDDDSMPMTHKMLIACRDVSVELTL